MTITTSRAVRGCPGTCAGNEALNGAERIEGGSMFDSVIRAKATSFRRRMTGRFAICLWSAKPISAAGRVKPTRSGPRFYSVAMSTLLKFLW